MPHHVLVGRARRVQVGDGQAHAAVAVKAEAFGEAAVVAQHALVALEADGQRRVVHHGLHFQHGAAQLVFIAPVVADIFDDPDRAVMGIQGIDGAPVQPAPEQRAILAPQFQFGAVRLALGEQWRRFQPQDAAMLGGAVQHRARHTRQLVARIAEHLGGADIALLDEAAPGKHDTDGRAFQDGLLFQQGLAQGLLVALLHADVGKHQGRARQAIAHRQRLGPHLHGDGRIDSLQAAVPVPLAPGRTQRATQHAGTRRTVGIRKTVGQQAARHIPAQQGAQGAIHRDHHAAGIAGAGGQGDQLQGIGDEIGTGRYAVHGHHGSVGSGRNAPEQYIRQAS